MIMILFLVLHFIRALLTIIFFPLLLTISLVGFPLTCIMDRVDDKLRELENQL